MEKKVKVKESCCACEANMLKAVDGLVEGAEKNTSKAAHDKKKEELEDAFKKDAKK